MGECGDLLLQHGLLVPVDDGGVFDVHGLAGVLERVQTLLKVRLGRTHARYHVGVRVTSQTVL